MTVEARRAGRRFGARQVFSGLDLDLHAGERLFLRGTNGSGKTTLLRCLAGTLATTSGTLHVGGADAGASGRRGRIGICLRPEEAHYLKLTGHANLLFAARLRLPAERAAVAVEAVEDELAMRDYRHERVQRYSSGMRATLATARALVGEPDLLLLDEPTRSMDTSARARLWDAVDRRAVTCVIASHTESDADHCDRTLDMPVLR